jgi:hypothetical protein
LLLKGYENKRKQHLGESDETPREKETGEQKKEEAAAKPKVSLFTSLKEKINDIFEENDTSM